jgi:DNA-binding PadR family transcriptional regulator
MRPRDHSLLELALMGLIRLCQPCSGYDLRKVFAGGPMAIFSDSPGSIYPALKRLEKSGMLSCVVDAPSGLRRRKLYRLNPKGKRELERWLGQPIDGDDVISGMPELLLRFSYLEDCLGPAACRSFLESLAVALERYVVTLRAHQQAVQSQMSRSARLALRSGIMGYECQLAWARTALAEFGRSTVRKHSSTRRLP